MDGLEYQKELNKLNYQKPSILLNMYDWDQSGKQWPNYAIPGHEITEEVYFYFIGVVPPIYKHRGFLVGEPYGRNKKGQKTYMGFVQGRGLDSEKYFYVGITDAESFNRRYSL